MDCLQAIETAYNFAKRHSCCDAGCELGLARVGRHIVLKGEILCGHNSVCDCIIFLRSKKMIIAIVELKNRAAHADDIERQLSYGSQKALEIIKHSGGVQDFEIFHIVLSTSWRSIEYAILANKRINVNGMKYRIIAKRCGTDLQQIIEDFGSD